MKTKFYVFLLSFIFLSFDNSSLYVDSNINLEKSSYSDTFNSTPPLNDLCVNAFVGNGVGTTCCATSDNFGCAIENTVWHIFTPTDPNVNIKVTIENVSILGAMGVDIFIGDCLNPNITISNCQSASLIQEEIYCMSGSIYVQISSMDDVCGAYKITFDEIPAICNLGQDCGSDILLDVNTNEGGNCASACNIDYCSTECGQGTTWFEINTDSMASIMEFTIDAGFIPSVVLRQGSCTGTEIIQCKVGENFSLSVFGNEKYFLGISSVDDSLGDITVCVYTFIEFSNCSSGELTITRPEYPDLPQSGPFCSGEKVNFCYDLDFTVDGIGYGNNCQRLQGIIPSIGGGWDLEACPINLANPGQGAFWLDAGEVNYLTLFSVFGIGANCEGLEIVEFGTGVGPGTGLPGGWWFVSNGDGTSCTNTGNPNTMWGLNTGCGSISTVSFCFDLQTKSISDPLECIDGCSNELNVGLFVFADGQTGCWNSNFCTDQPTEFVTGKMACNNLVTIDGIKEIGICSGESLQYTFTASNLAANIRLSTNEPPLVSGIINDTVFSGGNILLTDTLYNTGNSKMDVVYTMKAEGLSECNGPPFKFKVTVYPEYELFFESNYDVCWNDQETMELEHNVDGNFTYTWDNGFIGNPINYPQSIGQFSGTYSYSVTVANEIGCSTTIEIPYTINEEVKFEIEQDTGVAVINNYESNITICLNITQGQGNGPFSFNWTPLEGLETTIYENCIIIHEELSSPDVYQISSIISDQFDCQYIVNNISFVIEEIDLEADEDGDGFSAGMDCNDNDVNISPDSTEIPNNDIDEDCDGVALIIDNDGDGYNSDEDCDDASANVNPGQTEIPNNDIDEDCDGIVLVIDEDMDGYNSDEDCDDASANVNPGLMEIPNNEIDEDCDGIALVIDEDMDGFNSDDDCDDNSADVNPGQDEIPNNDIDEDCDGAILVIDEDMDGFNSDEDCDDMNADIYPGAEEIPDNGIDEDCNEVDEMTDSIIELNGINVQVFPNPVIDQLSINSEAVDNLQYTLFSIEGKVLLNGKIARTQELIDMTKFEGGLYILKIGDAKGEQARALRIVKF